MKIIDGQIHEPQIGGRHAPDDLPGGITPEVQTFINVELAREAIDCLGIDKALLFARQEFNEAAVARYPDRFGAVLVFDWAAEDLEEQIAAFRAKPGMLACRSILTNYAMVYRDPEVTQLHLRPEVESGGLDRYWALAAKYDLPIFLSAGDFCEYAGICAERHPELTVIVDHYGTTQSLARPIEGDRWRSLPKLLEMARYPNLYVKFCGVQHLSREPYPHRDVWPQLHRILAAYGPERCLWASDYTRGRWGTSTPPDEHGFPRREDWMPYSDNLHFFRDTNEISESDKKWLLGDTVRKALRWQD